MQQAVKQKVINKCKNKSMSEKIKLILLSLCLLAGQIAFSQTDKEKALQKGQEAIKLMDNGNIDRSIALHYRARTQ